MSDLEKQFHKAMINIYEAARDECGYNATALHQMVGENGGIATAKSLILNKMLTLGFLKLWELKRLDLTVEALVINDQYHDLFSDYERDVCRKRLEDHGYEF